MDAQQERTPLSVREQRIYRAILTELVHIRAQVDDMQPRVEMLNHWHDTVDAWRSDVDKQLGVVKWVRYSAMLGGAAAVCKAAFDVAHTLGYV